MEKNEASGEERHAEDTSKMNSNTEAEARKPDDQLEEDKKDHGRCKCTEDRITHGAILAIIQNVGKVKAIQ